METKVPVASPKRQACKGEWEDGAQPAASVPAVTVDVAAAKVSSRELCAVPHEETAAASSGLTFRLTGAPGRRSSSVGSGSQLKAGGWSSLNITADHQQTQVPSEDAPARRRESQRHPAQSTSDCRKVLKTSGVGGHFEDTPALLACKGRRQRSSIVSSPILSRTVKARGRGSEGFSEMPCCLLRSAHGRLEKPEELGCGVGKASRSAG